MATASSPNGKLKAVIFERDCGATTGFSKQISILPVSKDLPNEPGNIFRTNSYYGYDPENPEGGSTEIEARWLGNNDLLITTHNPRAEIWQAKQMFDGINVKYEVTVKSSPNKSSEQITR